MWHRRLSAIGVATLVLTTTSVSGAGAAVIENGGFETGDFTGWQVELHQVVAPVSPPPDYDPLKGAQVLTEADIFVNGVEGGLPPPGGSHYALISSLPSNKDDETDDCASTADNGQQPMHVPYMNVDQDPFGERDITQLSQQFMVDRLPAFLSFDWSLLAGEKTKFDGPDDQEHWLHDDFQVTLRPVSPSGPTIQVLGLTEGAQRNDSYYCNTPPCPYTGTFTFINPAELDGKVYQVLTAPPGGPTDCHYSQWGRTEFRRSTFAIPATGTWEVKFYVGDDGGDAKKTTGVLLDNVQVSYLEQAPALSSGGTMLLVTILSGIGLLGLATRRVRPRAARIGLRVLLVVGSAVALSPSWAASRELGAVGASAGADSAAASVGEQIALQAFLPTATPRRTPTPRTLPNVPTRTPPRATPTVPARRTPVLTPPPTRPRRNTQTPLAS